ncbi:hypothetical protein [Candidatus Entotheonella palauensis]|uniref:hypothetical protein n=1 Tax=Candidatus Entotheonella palauensis TaxID=93172 RepID=UPI001178598A|nr:hypothetical protein [Candidatus Entotheonella palauensis]
MARRLGYTVVASAQDKLHGLREVYLLDADGSCGYRMFRDPFNALQRVLPLWCATCGFARLRD